MGTGQIPTGRLIDTGTVKLHCTDMGSGDPVVMIHGGGPGATGWSNYNRNAEALAARHRVIIIDLPGYGKSEKPTFPPGLFAFYAGAVRGLLDALEIEKAHLVGNSLGGLTSLKFALDYPDRLNRLVLMGAGAFSIFSPMPTQGLQLLLQYYDGDGPTIEKLAAFVKVMVWDPSEVTDGLLEERFEASIQPDILARPPFGRGALPSFEPIWREDLSQIRSSTLLLWGRDDRVVPLDSAFLPLKQIPDCQLHVFSQCGHWVQWERAEAFNRLVLDFLAS